MTVCALCDGYSSNANKRNLGTNATKLVSSRELVAVASVHSIHKSSHLVLFGSRAFFV